MHKLNSPTIAFFGFVLLAVIAAAIPNPSLGQEQDSATKLNCDETPCDAVARGRAAFNRRNLVQLGGNGRSCADCHMPSEGFQLSPASARARYDALQSRREHDGNADDPLFRAVDADDFRINGDNAVDFSNLVEN